MVAYLCQSTLAQHHAAEATTASTNPFLSRDQALYSAALMLCDTSGSSYLGEPAGNDTLHLTWLGRQIAGYITSSYS